MPVELRERRAKRSDPDSEDLPLLTSEERTGEPPKKRRRKAKKTPKQKNKKETSEKKTKKQQPDDGDQQVPKPKKKYPYKYRPRPNAAVKERERLVVFNQAFAQLQDKLPERLQVCGEKRMPKKLILRFAVRYIKFLQEELDREPGEHAPEMALSPEELGLWEDEDKGWEAGWHVGGSPTESSESPASELSMELIDLCEIPSPFRLAGGKLEQPVPRAGEGRSGIGRVLDTRAPGRSTGRTNEPCTGNKQNLTDTYRTGLPNSQPVQGKNYGKPNDPCKGNEPTDMYRTGLQISQLDHMALCKATVTTDRTDTDRTVLPNSQLAHMALCKCTECSTPLLPDDTPSTQPSTPPDTSSPIALYDYINMFPSYVDSIPDIRGELPALTKDLSADSSLADTPRSMFDPRGLDRTPPKGSGKLRALTNDLSADSSLADTPRSLYDPRGPHRTPPKGSPAHHQPLSPYNTQITSPSLYEDELSIKLQVH